MSAPALLDVDGLHVRYRVRGGSFEVLHDINFSLGAGEVLGVVGESGCGKSTLGAAVLGLLPANGRIAEGCIALEGEDLTRMDEATLRGVRGRRVGMIFQDPLTSFNPTFRVSTQMINAQRAHGLEERNGGTSLRQRAVDMLERVGIPDAGDRIDEYPHHFSGGMRQRIMIATSLLLEPRLLICDEATSALDVTLQAQILELLRELGREQGTAIMFISHDIGVISEICEKMLILYAGRVVETGDVGSVLSQPAHPYTRRLIAAVPSRDRRHERLSMIPGRVPSLADLPPGCTFATRCDYVQRPVCDEAEPALLTTKDRRLARCLIYAPESAYDQEEAERVAERTERSDPPPSPEVSDEVLLDLDDLCTHFGGGPGRIGRLLGRRGSPPVRAIDGVHLQLRRGEAVGLVGESGSGKTTLGKTVLNLVERTAGGITFDGQPLHELDRGGWRDMRSRMQMIFQEPHGSLSPRLSVSTLLIEPYRINDTPADERYDVDELLEMVGLSAEQATKYPHELSGGQARRVGIARALAVRPDFIVADEPTSGLDVSAAASVLNLLADLRRQLGLTYLIITHDLNLVGYATDRIAVMYLGKIVEIAASDAIFDEPRHPYTQALLASIPDPTTQRKTSTVGAAVAGEIPSPRNPPSGCRFRTRCPYAEQRCADEVPVLGLGEDPHGVACHFWDSIADGTKPQTGPLPAEASDAESAPVG